MKKKIFPIIGIIIGVAFIIQGYLIWSDHRSSNHRNRTYGADFYTDIYTDVDNIRVGVADMRNEVKQISGSLLVGVGLIDICAFGFILCNLPEDKKVLPDSQAVEQPNDSQQNV